MPRTKFCHRDVSNRVISPGSKRSCFHGINDETGLILPVELEPSFYACDVMYDESGFLLATMSIDCIKSEFRRIPRPGFGVMPETDWIKLHCRHSELHLSFLGPSKYTSGDHSPPEH